jgi:hypothetical protein
MPIVPRTRRIRERSASALPSSREVLVGLVEVKPTPTSLGDVQTISALELVDVGVLVVTLRLLENRRPLAFRELGQGGQMAPAHAAESRRCGACARAWSGSDTLAFSRSRRARSITARG